MPLPLIEKLFMERGSTWLACRQAPLVMSHHKERGSTGLPAGRHTKCGLSQGGLPSKQTSSLSVG